MGVYAGRFCLLSGDSRIAIFLSVSFSSICDFGDFIVLRGGFLGLCFSVFGGWGLARILVRYGIGDSSFLRGFG